MFFEMIYETNLVGLLSVFALGATVGIGAGIWMFKLIQKRQVVVDPARMARLRAQRAWDA